MDVLELVGLAVKNRTMQQKIDAYEWLIDQHLESLALIPYKDVESKGRALLRHWSRWAESSPSSRIAVGFSSAKIKVEFHSRQTNPMPDKLPGGYNWKTKTILLSLYSASEGPEALPEGTNLGVIVHELRHAQQHSTLEDYSSGVKNAGLHLPSSKSTPTPSSRPSLASSSSSTLLTLSSVKRKTLTTSGSVGKLRATPRTSPNTTLRGGLGIAL